MASEDQTSPANKRQLSLSPEPANAPTTPASEKRLKTDKGHGIIPSRLLNCNMTLGKQVSELQKTVEEQAARIEKLERMAGILNENVNQEL